MEKKQTDSGMGSGSGSGGDAFSVLVVDDDLVHRVFLRGFLKRLGLEVREVENGIEAVDLHVKGAFFDLILIDKDMREMNGCQTVKTLRAMGVESKIVGITSCDSSAALTEFKESGLNDCFPKPLNVHKLAGYLPPHLQDIARAGSSSSD